MDVIPDEGDLPQMEVGSGGPGAIPGALPQWGPTTAGGREPKERRRAPSQWRRQRVNPGGQAGQCAEGLDFESQGEGQGEEFDDWEDDYDYLEEEPLSGADYRISAAQEANKIFLRISRAREAALGGGFQMHYEKTPFDQLAFIEELFSLMVVNRLTEELGCDEIIDSNLVAVKRGGNYLRTDPAFHCIWGSFQMVLCQ
ncbi:EP300-interacting inhibitor of differentiation 1 [Tupaia chinensis]|uniref:EP300-interacting inhibitor of differentiation 1 n=1 Tax=Tupaia chinensis TaxID=246437 RepID=L8YFZ0_TUPCH|nr:EP300-interacting inhibitor of differentiation 1 [Tupaia chinensis]